MKIFTYNQYIRYIHKVRLNAVLQLAEESEEYCVEGTTHKHDKLMKKILEDKKETLQLVNNFLVPKEKIQMDQLMRYTNSYITKKYKSKEADLVYKLKNKEIYFLIEHQSYIDNTMPYRILNYCVDIIQEWNRNKKITKNSLYPIIVPVVIYTGTTKWKVPVNFSQKQIPEYIFERHNINLEYNLIDINKLSCDFLLSQNSKFGYAMLIEKSKDKNELVQNLNRIIKTTKAKEKLEEISNIIIYILDKTLNEEEKTELLNKIEKKVGDEKMSTLIDRIIMERKRDVKEGINKGISKGIIQGISQGMAKSKKQIAKNMLNLNMEDEFIIKATGIEKEELEKLKNEKE